MENKSQPGIEDGQKVNHAIYFIIRSLVLLFEDESQAGRQMDTLRLQKSISNGSLKRPTKPENPDKVEDGSRVCQVLQVGECQL